LRRGHQPRGRILVPSLVEPSSPPEAPVKRASSIMTAIPDEQLLQHAGLSKGRVVLITGEGLITLRYC
jgi:hypothetical protein